MITSSGPVAIRTGRDSCNRNWSSEGDYHVDLQYSIVLLLWFLRSYVNNCTMKCNNYDAAKVQW